MNELKAKEALRIIEYLTAKGWALDEIKKFINAIING